MRNKPEPTTKEPHTGDPPAPATRSPPTTIVLLDDTSDDSDNEQMESRLASGSQGSDESTILYKRNIGLATRAIVIPTSKATKHFGLTTGAPLERNVTFVDPRNKSWALTLRCGLGNGKPRYSLHGVEDYVSSYGLESSDVIKLSVREGGNGKAFLIAHEYQALRQPSLRNAHTKQPDRFVPGVSHFQPKRESKTAVPQQHGGPGVRCGTAPRCEMTAAEPYNATVLVAKFLVLSDLNNRQIVLPSAAAHRAFNLQPGADVTICCDAEAASHDLGFDLVIRRYACCYLRYCVSAPAVFVQDLNLKTGTAFGIVLKDDGVHAIELDTERVRTAAGRRQQKSVVAEDKAQCHRGSARRDSEIGLDDGRARHAVDREQSPNPGYKRHRGGYKASSPSLSTGKDGENDDGEDVHDTRTKQQRHGEKASCQPGSSSREEKEAAVQLEQPTKDAQLVAAWQEVARLTRENARLEKEKLEAEVAALKAQLGGSR
jgi:hypothetical protein